ncbi:MAG: hypothetical protein JXB26_14330 [Candidatus Aminicenantes bacterium]|nr:hypothetical protein [Candidatus Aminicenantes bacterium]
MTIPLINFQELIREFFQFDCADLDFGIYRIMNYNRDNIERLIMRALPETVSEGIDCEALTENQSPAPMFKVRMFAQVRS